MSNARIFCIGFVAWISLTVFAKLIGFDGRYAGISEHVVRISIALTWGAWAVALWGDRNTTTPTMNLGEQG